MKKIYFLVVLMALLSIGCKSFFSSGPRFYKRIQNKDGFDFELTDKVSAKESSKGEIYVEEKLKGDTTIIRHLVDSVLTENSYWGENAAEIKYWSNNEVKTIQFFNKSGKQINDDFLSEMKLERFNDKYYFQIVNNFYTSYIPNNLIVSKNPKEKLQIVLFKNDFTKYLNITNEASDGKIKNMNEFYDYIYSTMAPAIMSYRAMGIENKIFKGDIYEYSDANIKIEYMPITIKTSNILGQSKSNYFYYYLISNMKNTDEKVFIGTIKGIESKLSKQELDGVMIMLKSSYFSDGK